MSRYFHPDFYNYVDMLPIDNDVMTENNLRYTQEAMWELYIQQYTRPKHDEKIREFYMWLLNGMYDSMMQLSEIVITDLVDMLIDMHESDHYVEYFRASPYATIEAHYYQGDIAFQDYDDFHIISYPIDLQLLDPIVAQLNHLLTITKEDIAHYNAKRK